VRIEYAHRTGPHPRSESARDPRRVHRPLGLAEIIVAKNRRGPTGTVTTAFLRRYARFADLALPAAQREELEAAHE
jgi:replicative DNA helicase